MTIYSHRTYLQKQRFAPRQILAPPNPDLRLVVVIPSHVEPDLCQPLRALEACHLPKGAVEVIVVVNASRSADAATHQKNKESLEAVNRWLREAPRHHKYFVLDFPDLPPKHAGVGLARKVGMDEAVDRLEQVDAADGVIICLDADSSVAPNYLTEIEALFQHQPRLEACSIHFEHPLSGDAFPPEVYTGIIHYELFLRYYIQALRFAGYPYAYHTIGSSMAVRSSAYQAQGGMNRRKAGEDFYFLHKFIPHGGFAELGSTTVYPSPRASEKVPFGTGRAISAWLKRGDGKLPAYALQSFEELKAWHQQIPDLYEQPLKPLPPAISAFLEAEGVEAAIVDTRFHVRSHKGFIKRMYQWWHPLRVLKYVHYAREHFYPDSEVTAVAAQLFKREKGENIPKARDLLLQYRIWQR